MARRRRRVGRANVHVRSPWNEKRDGWLDDLTVGSEVVVKRNTTNTPTWVRKVERVTKTQLVLDNGDKFWLKNGREVGSSNECWFEFLVKGGNHEPNN